MPLDVRCRGSLLELSQVVRWKRTASSFRMMLVAQRDHAFRVVVRLNGPLGIEMMIFEVWISTRLAGSRNRAPESNLLAKRTDDRRWRVAVHCSNYS